MLMVKNLSKAFNKVQAVKDVSLEIKDGEIVGLIGPNGAGKTTLIRCIIGSLRMDEGTVRYGEFDLVEQTIECRRMLGFVPEIPNPFQYLTPMEHLKYVAEMWGLEDWEKRAEVLLKEFGLEEKKNEVAMRLSKGQKQKILICMVILHDPKVLMMDEPLIGVDPRGQKAIKDHIRALRKQGSSVFISTHVLPLIEEVCDRFVIMDKGSFVATGTIEDVRKSAHSLEELLIRTTEE